MVVRVVAGALSEVGVASSTRPGRAGARVRARGGRVNSGGLMPRLRERVAGRGAGRCQRAVACWPGYAWRPEQDSNLRPLAPEASALSAELSGQLRQFSRLQTPARDGEVCHTSGRSLFENPSRRIPCASILPLITPVLSSRKRSSLHLREAGHDVVDHGAHVFDALDDYPPFCIEAAQAVVG